MMDSAEHVRRRSGEYYNPEMESDYERERRENGRLREIIERLRDEDNRQNHRIQVLEDSMNVMLSDINRLWQSHNRIEVALIGPDGKNGMRGKMDEQYQAQSSRIDGLAQDVTRVVRELSELTTTTKTVGKILGSISVIIGTVGTIVGIIVLF
jgi:hypothetical protein